MKNILRLCALLLLLLAGRHASFAQVSIASWNPSSLSGFGPSPWAATASNANVNVGGLTRGSGVGISGTAAGSAWGGVNWTGATTADATFTLEAKAGSQLSLSSLSLFYRRSSTGPGTGTLDYAIGSGPYTNITTFSFSSTTSSGAQLPAVDLSSIANLQGVPNGTVIKIRILPTGGGSAGTWYVFSSGLSVTGTVGANGPQVIVPTTQSIDSSFARLGANVSNDRGSAITERGIVWSLAANPQVGQPGVTKVTVPGTTGVFDTLVKGLPVGSYVHFRGFATNVSGTGYTNDTAFYTLASMPAAVGNLTALATSAHNIGLKWMPSPAAQGYLVIQKMDAAPGSFPQNGRRYNEHDMIGDGEIVDTLPGGSTDTASYTGLISGTLYYYAVVPYRFNGINNETYRYNSLMPVPVAGDTTFGTAPSRSSDMVLDTSASPLSISSMINDTLKTDTSGIRVLRLVLRDGGASLNDGDDMPTTLRRIVINKGTASTAGSWLNLVRFAALFDDSTHLKLADATLSADSMVFSSLAFAASDNNYRTASLRIALKTSGIHDNDTLQFRISQSNIITDPLSLGSQLQSFSLLSDAARNHIAVKASRIVLTQQPVDVRVNVLTATSVVKAELQDGNGNKDLDYSKPVFIASQKSIMQLPSSFKLPVNGMLSFDSITFKSIAGSNRIRLYTQDLDTVYTNPFNIFASNASDIAVTPGFAYTDSIVYASYQEATALTATNAVPVFGISLRDGGAAANDADTFPTVLSRLDLSVLQGSSFIRRAALFMGNTKLADVAVTDTIISFAGIAASAPDDSTAKLVLMVSFNSRYAQAQRIQFRVKLAVADTSMGSLFVSSNAGLASSSVAGANNVLKYNDVVITAPQAVNARVCKGGTAKLTALKNAGTLRWYLSPSSTTPVFTGDTFSISNVMATLTYYTEYDSAEWLSARVPVKAEAVQTQSPQVAALQVCNGQTASLQAVSANAVTWYNGFTTSNAIGSGNTFAVGAIWSDTLLYAQADSAGCKSERVAANVSIRSVTPPVVRDTTVCSGSMATLSAMAPGTLKWYATPTGNSIASGAAFGAGAMLKDTVFFVAVDSSGCSSSRLPLSVHAFKVATPVVSNNTVCSGNAALLIASHAGGTAKWFATSTSATPLAAGDSLTTAPLTTAATYYIQVSQSGCTGDRLPVSVSVNPTPAIQPFGTDSVCNGSSKTLSINAGTAQVSWYDDAAGTILLRTGPTYPLTSVVAAKTYYVQASAQGCQSALLPYPLAIKPKPAMPIATDAQTCTGKPVTLKANAAAGKIKWFGNVSDTSGVFGDSILTASITTNVSYYAAAVLNGCSSDRKEVKVKANPTPSTVFSINNAEQCLHNNQFVFVNNASPSGTLYAWDFGDSSSFAFSNPVKTYSRKGTYLVKLKVTGSTGCTADTTGTVTVSAPDADFSFTATGKTVSFSTTLSNISTYKWTFTPSDSSALASPVFTFPASGNYLVSLQVADNKGCLASTSKLVQAIATGVADAAIEAGSVQVYPNPLQGQGAVSYTLHSTQKVNVKLLDVLGREVMQLYNGEQQAGRHTLDLPNPGSGMYFLTITAGSTVHTVRVTAP